MPPEHLMMIDLKALGSIRLECNKCHAAFSFRVAEKVEIPLQCFACKERFTGEAVMAMKNLLDAFAAWAQAHDPTFTLRFEMSPMMHAAPPRPPSKP